MLSRVCSAAVNGIEAYPVEVEVNVGIGDTLVIMIAMIHPKPLWVFHCNEIFFRNCSNSDST
jgi:hypothetical protein